MSFDNDWAFLHRQETNCIVKRLSLLYDVSNGTRFKDLDTNAYQYTSHDTIVKFLKEKWLVLLPQNTHSWDWAYCSLVRAPVIITINAGPPEI